MEEVYDANTAKLLAKWPVLHIFKAGRQSFQASKLVLAALGLLATLLLGVVLDFMWMSSGGGHSGAELRENVPPLIVDYAALGDEDAIGPFALLRQHTAYCIDQTITAARKLQLGGGMGSIRDHLNRGGAAVDRPDVGDGYGAVAFFIALLNGWFWMLRTHWLFAGVCGVAMLALWSLVGGAICRIATCNFARDEFLTYREALQFSSQRLWAFFLGPAILLAMMAFLGVGIVVITLILNMLITVSWLSWLAWLGWIGVGLLSILGLFAGVLIALLAFGMLGGGHLMWPTVAAEGSDFTDAISRSGYFLQAVERSIGYFLAALVYGALAWTVVRGVAFLAVWTTHGFMELGLNDLDKIWATPAFDSFYVAPAERVDGALGGSFAPFMIKMWVGLFGIVVSGYLVSYYFTSTTIIYHLLRQAVDETELDDIYLDTGDQNDAVGPVEPPKAGDTGGGNGARGEGGEGGPAGGAS